MRRDVQEIFKITPHEKQVMMFSATLSKEIRPVCRKFMQDVSEDRCIGSATILLPQFFFSRDLLVPHATVERAGLFLFSQPMEVFVDDETKLTLHGLQQYYSKLKDSEKNRKLFDLLDALEFNQVCERTQRKIVAIGSRDEFTDVKFWQHACCSLLRH